MAAANASAKLSLSLDAIIAQSSKSGGRGSARGYSSRGGPAWALSEFDAEPAEHRESAPAPSGGERMLQCR